MAEPQDPQDVRTQLSFNDKIADASLAHLLELMLMLHSYNDGLVVVGGWAPYFLLKQYQKPDDDFEHVGSVDIDIAVNPNVVDDIEYAKLEELLQGRGYEQSPDARYTYIKKIGESGREIHVDFLAPMDGGTGSSHRHQRVQNDFLVRKAKGADLAFTHRFEYTLTGQLPNGADASATFYVADIVAMIAMKSYVLGQRYKDKDAYDLYSLIMHYKNGVASIAEEVKPFVEQPPLPEGMENLKTWFATQNSAGPAAIADFFHETGTPRDQRTQEAFLQLQRLIELLNG